VKNGEDALIRWKRPDFGGWDGGKTTGAEIGLGATTTITGGGVQQIHK